MDNDSISNSSTHSSAFQDAQGHWYSHLSSSVPSLLTSTTIATATTPTMAPSLSMPLLTATGQEYREQEIVPIPSETMCISSDDDSRDQQKHQEEMTSILSQEWLPPAASTPLSAVSTNTVRSEREIENELFHNIEQLVREFLDRPNRQYPYYRVMRWTTGEQPKIEHIVTVVINRPVIIL
jgi:hypothetical protein